MSRLMKRDTNLIANILRYHAFLLFYSFHIFRIFPSKLWCQWDDNSWYPNKKYHQWNATSCSRMNIINIRDRPITGKEKHKSNQSLNFFFITFLNLYLDYRIILWIYYFFSFIYSFYFLSVLFEHIYGSI